MKRIFYISLATLMVLAVSCKKDDKTKHVPEGAVDLGIVMTREDGTTYNLYWAESNLSEDGLCANPEEFGDYYAWGETVPHYLKGHSQDSPCSDWRITDGLWEYDWPYYKWNGGDPYKIIKYCPEDQSRFWAGVGTPDGKMVLETGPDGDDAASKILGGKWRMPTNEEWTELMEKCEWSWTDNYNGTGVIGRIVTSNIEGFKDRSIFIPCAGIRNGNMLQYQEDTGEYWSSSLYADYPSSAWGMASYPDKVLCGDEGRHKGLSIRPVYED